MSEPTQVYVVTSGQYSDYGINSVWLTYEEAKAEAGEWGRVEVYPLGENARSLGTFSHSCQIDISTHAVREFDAQDSPDVDETGRTSVLWWPDLQGIYKNQLGIRVSASTAERAAKVYSETKARVLAELAQGLPPELIADHKYVPGLRDPWVPTDRTHGEARRSLSGGSA